MPDIKEKPPAGKPKAKPPAVPKQAARLMKEKYLQQLDQRPSGLEGETGYAPEQVEDAGRWAVDELAVHRPDHRPRRVKEKPRAGAEPTPADTAAAGGGTPATERPTAKPKERQAVERRESPAGMRRDAAPRTSLPKERTAARTLKERTAQSHAAQPPQAPDPAPAPTHSTSPRQAQRQFTLNNRRRGSAAYRQPAGSTGPRSAPNAPVSGDARPFRRASRRVGIPDTTAGTPMQKAGAVKERTQDAKAALKARPQSKGAAKAGRVIPKSRPAAPPSSVRMAARKARQQVQQQVSRAMSTQAAKAVRTAAVAAKRVAVAVVKAAAALIGAVVSIAGGGILLVALVIVVVIAAVANSPFGLFFAEERNAPDTVSVAEAVSTVNMAYNARLEDLQAGDYDSIVIQGQAADWPDVLAVFAVKLAGADADGVDVATLDSDRVDRLTAVFWDMTAITSYVETIDHPGIGDDDPGWTEYILHITITPNTADDMRTTYSFTNYQNSALDELLADRAALSALAGSLTITNADVSAILDALPTDLTPERREAVRTALQPVGKVNYFWGGKSYAIGWDSRWGTLQKVWADGSSTTGTYRPYGLDCSGFVDWVFNNSMGYIIGHGGGVIMQHTYCTDIPWSAAQPGDIALISDASHVGLVVGRSADGGILVCHCSSGQNNVVITDCAATGFTAIGRPDVF